MEICYSMESTNEPLMTDNTETMTNQETDQTHYDVIIAGAGISGLLVAHRYCSANPNSKVLLLEKDSRAGGRLGTVSNDEAADIRGQGFNAITPRLYEFWNQAIKHDPEADDLPSLVSGKQTKTAVLMGNKFSEVDTKNLYSEKGARILGGMAAQRQWKDVQALFDAEDKFDHTFADVWKAPRKSPATMVLETYAQAAGWSPFLFASAKALTSN